MIEKSATGGQAGTSSRIENYLGFPKGLSGADLAKRATDQAVRLGCEILTAVEAISVKVEAPYKIIKLSDGQEISCKALVIATGVELRELDAPGVKELTGAGIYYGAALTEAINYSGKEVYVVGGANSAGQGAMYFSRFANQVTMLVRGSSLEIGMSQYLVDQIHAQANIKVKVNTEVKAVRGETKLEQIVYFNMETNREENCPVDAMFIFIGAQAHTELVDGVVERNLQGFIITGQDLVNDRKYPKGWKLKRAPYFLETSVPGIFAAGDVRQGAVRRVASAVGQGAIAVALVHQYLREV
jgi:thioredoxin reductase (NADPH)